MRTARPKLPTAMDLLRATANCTYTVQSTIDTWQGLRYLLRRSDGRVCNVDRASYVRIERSGKIVGGLNR